MTKTTLDDPVQFLKGVGPARARDFARLGIYTVRDLIFTFPRDISDRSQISTIAEAPVGSEVALLVRPIACREKEVRGGRLKLTIVEFTDSTGSMEAVWFNSPWISDKLTTERVLLYGKTKHDYGTLKMEHPKYELIENQVEENALNIGRIVPLYPCTGKLNQQIWRKAMMHALETRLDSLERLYPDDFLRKRNFPDRRTAIHDMHFPPDTDARSMAEERLKYDEALLMQLVICLSRRHFREDLPGRRFRISRELDRRIRKLFPFRLTAAQDRAVREISADMESPLPMHRLLQGDVGSGKTAVALYAMLAAVAGKAQVCIMAPTGLLARQHLQTMSDFLANSRQSKVQVALMPGSMKKKERKLLLTRLASGAIDILIATHAAIQADVVFRDLGLVVIDEQHKFGVHQRASLLAKGMRPDTLVMTATPIPRSLALTVYGDLDVSVIDELPPGRKPVKTTVPGPVREPEVWQFLRSQLTQGRQAFVVSPLVEENEELDLKSATQAFREFSENQLAGFRLALLHGRMKREEQQKIMAGFRAGAIDVLVSTVVIEVGVDIPNANIMVVLHAERFGLAQLHQLRGRIGRGREQGHFILLSHARTPEARERLSALSRTSDGFKIAEHDLRMRGPGEFLGSRQHGLPDLKLVDIVRDMEIIQGARNDAQKLLSVDPNLRSPSHLALRTELERMRDQKPVAGVG